MVVSRDSQPAGEQRAQDDSDQVLVRLIRLLNVETDRFAELFGEAHGLHRTDLNALVVIMDANRRGERISPTQLARALQLSASATTAVLDRLEKAGHVRRDRSSHDRRRMHLVMPEHTLRLGEQLFGPLGAALAQAWAEFGSAERTTIARFLQLSIDTTIAVRAQLPQASAGPS